MVMVVTMGLYLMLLNYTLKSGKDGAGYGDTYL
jgi:hypothetical protein